MLDLQIFAVLYIHIPVAEIIRNINAMTTNRRSGRDSASNRMIVPFFFLPLPSTLLVSLSSVLVALFNRGSVSALSLLLTCSSSLFGNEVLLINSQSKIIKIENVIADEKIPQNQGSERFFSTSEIAKSLTSVKKIRVPLNRTGNGCHIFVRLIVSVGLHINASTSPRHIAPRITQVIHRSNTEMSKLYSDIDVEKCW